LELLIEAGTGYTVYDKPVQETIAKLEEFLQQDMQVSFLLSPSLPLRLMHQSLQGSGNWHLPEEEDAYHRYRPYLVANNTKIPLALADSTGRWGRLTGKTKDEGRRTMEKKYERLQSWLSRNTDPAVARFSLTGSDYLTDISHQRRIENMVTGFLIEILVVGLLIGLLYQSWRLVLITFLANIIPMLIVGGVMGLTGIELRGTTTVIFAVGYVIAVDDTLHFVNRFQLGRKKGLSVPAAIRDTILHTGQAMVMTSLILLGGFLLLLHSSFGDIFYHGLLISIIIVTALVTDLLLTPVLMASFFPEKKKPLSAGRIRLFTLKTKKA
jgi:hypothetical protein